MSHELKPIIVLPEQIIAAAQKIANQDDDAWQYTPEQYLNAVRSFLEASINNLVYDAEWHATKDLFDADKEFTFSLDFAPGFDIPEPPEWATDKSLQPAIQ